MEAARKRPDDGILIITGGDPAGIGPELLLELTVDLARIPGPIIYFATGDTRHRHALVAAFRDKSRAVRIHASSKITPEFEPRENEFLYVDLTSGRDLVEPGKPGEESGRLAFLALKAAADWLQSNPGRSAGLLTAPVSKEWIARATGAGFPGHTDYLAERFDRRVMMLMHGRRISVIPLTIHIALERVGAELPGVLADEATLDLLIKLKSLAPFGGEQGRRWALCGLNPHAGEGGHLGTAEIDYMAAAAERWRSAGLPVDGPLPADGVFMSPNRDRYRLVLACYHDQGLAPFKALEGAEGVNCTIGLPFPRTSPDHGTAFEIAGRGRADAGSMRRALAVLYSGELESREASAW